MMTNKDAMKLALEALESGKNHGVAIDVLRRALANEALDKMAEHARESGLDYEPSSVSKLAREAGIRDCTCNGTKGCLERFAELIRADERARMAEQPAQQQEPVISVAHGPWIPSTHPGEEGESYCKRCLLRDKFLGSRQCDPHIVPPEQPAQQEEPVLQDIEQYRLQMAGISTAAIGYWKEGDGIHPDYDTLALRDVAKLYAKYDELCRAQPAQRTWVGLTDEERSKIWGELPSTRNEERDACIFAECIEIYLKERNT